MRKYLLDMLILLLLNFNTGYAGTDADLCFKMMSLCCTNSNSIHADALLALNITINYDKIR